MNFKEFFLEKFGMLSNAQHHSIARTTGSKMHNTKGSLNFIATSRKKESLRNPNSNPNIGKGTEKQISSFEAKKLAEKSNGKKIKLSNVGSSGKTLNGKTGVKILKKNGKFYRKN